MAFARSPTLGGPWKRWGAMPQQTIEPPAEQPPNMENPVVTKSPWQPGYHAVYAALSNGSIGVTYSGSGEPADWSKEQHLPVRGRTGLGLVPEPEIGRGYYSLMYTSTQVWYALLRNEQEAKPPTTRCAEACIRTVF